MESKQKTLYKICCLSACLVALCTVSFVLSLLFTWDFSEWTNIESFKNTFKPIQMLSVIPSILLAISYVTFVSGLHIYASQNRKIWSQMALSFGLIYAGISIANYLIQLLTVIPSVQNEQTEGLTLLVIGRKLRIPQLGLKSDATRCTSCKQCDKSCAMGLDVADMVKSGAIKSSECILCGECVEACPQKAIAYTVKREKS